jgi:hypothetical protein
MAQYGVTDEAALLSGQLTHFAAAQHAGSSPHEVAERCGHAAGAVAHELRAQYRRALAAAAAEGARDNPSGRGEGPPAAGGREAQLRLAAAWYLVAYADAPAGGQPFLAAGGHEAASPPGAPPPRLLSFAWVGHAELKAIREQGLPPLSESSPERRREHAAAEVQLAQLLEAGSGSGGMPVGGGEALRLSSDSDD